MSTKKSKDPLYARDGYRSYPDEFPIYPTHEEFPSSGLFFAVKSLTCSDIDC